MGVIIIKERDESGNIVQTTLGDKGNVENIARNSSEGGSRRLGKIYILDLLTRVFLPAGYPNSVSLDYLRRYNVMQTTRVQLSSLERPPGILQFVGFVIVVEGYFAGFVFSLLCFGVGDPTASATKALLLTVLQDVFGRLTTILSAHFIGSSLYPEAKTYRFLADVLNDTAVILDTLSPFLNTFSIPGLRVASLCLSAIFKSLCGICAGGSKAAITMHFATPLNGKGDVGDLNAKDASKETVLALFGMLLGTLIVPYLTTPLTTYTSLFILVGLHLTINYYGVRGLVLRSPNRQRLGILWSFYRHSPASKPLTPIEVARLERMFDLSGIIRSPKTNVPIGQCTIGSSFTDIVRSDCPCPPALLDIFNGDKYVIWFDRRSLKQAGAKDAVGSGGAPVLHGFIRLCIMFKEGFTRDDQLRAWLETVEICNIAVSASALGPAVDALSSVKAAHEAVSGRYAAFLRESKAVGWMMEDCAIMAGSPDSVIVDVAHGGKEFGEDRKTR